LVVLSKGWDNPRGNPTADPQFTQKDVGIQEIIEEVPRQSNYSP